MCQGFYKKQIFNTPVLWWRWIAYEVNISYFVKIPLYLCQYGFQVSPDGCWVMAIVSWNSAEGLFFMWCVVHSSMQGYLCSAGMKVDWLNLTHILCWMLSLIMMIMTVMISITEKCSYVYAPWECERHSESLTETVEIWTVSVCWQRRVSSCRAIFLSLLFSALHHTAHKDTVPMLMLNQTARQ